MTILHQPTDHWIRNITSFRNTAPDTLPVDSPRLFLGSDLLMGVVPPEARKGDILCQFWNTTACAVLRPKGWSLRRYEIVGRAAIVSRTHTGWGSSSDLGGELFGVSNQKAVEVPVSLLDLTRLSLDTVNLPAT